MIILLNKMRDELENILETNGNYFDELHQYAYEEIIKSTENKSVIKKMNLVD